MVDDRPLPARRRAPLGRYLVPVVCGFVGTVVIVLAVVLLGRGIGSAAGGGGGGGGGGSGGGGSGGGPVAAPVVATVDASCVRDPSHDSQGNPTSYEPARAVDGDPTTAWRCDGDGVGQHLTLGLAAPARVARVGLVPGIAKTDPGDGTDRYAQNRRIARVRITTDAGSVEATLDTDPGRRAMQYVSLDGAPTRSVTITVLGSVPGSEQNGKAAVESVAVAEVAVS